MGKTVAFDGEELKVILANLSASSKQIPAPDTKISRLAVVTVNSDLGKVCISVYQGEFFEFKNYWYQNTQLHDWVLMSIKENESK